MKRNNKKALYESIMTSVAKEVKKALNEYDGWTTTTTLDGYQQEPDFVDLGLSVKWAKYNLGATPSKKAKDWYGNFYAWGESVPKSSYGKGNYKFFNNSGDYIKYNDADHKIFLKSNDDAATVNCGRPWRMPTREELEELITLPNCWITNYKGIKGLNGRAFTGNGNTLFIPAAGYIYGYSVGDVRAYSGLWSSNLNLNRTDYAYFLGLDAGGAEMGSGSRWHGLSVRPVLD